MPSLAMHAGWLLHRLKEQTKVKHTCSTAAQHIQLSQPDKQPLMGRQNHHSHEHESSHNVTQGDGDQVLCDELAKGQLSTKGNTQRDQEPAGKRRQGHTSGKVQ
jgi:hypothetical protein